MEQNEQKSLDKTDSVEWSVNNKGQLSGKVKVYAETIEEAFTKALEYKNKMAEVIARENGLK